MMTWRVVVTTAGPADAATIKVIPNITLVNDYAARVATPSWRTYTFYLEYFGMGTVVLVAIINDRI